MSTVTASIWVQLLSAVVTVLFCCIGYIFAIGKFRASVMIKDECEKKRLHCTQTIETKIDKLIESISNMDKKIDVMDDKRERAKEDNNRSLMDINTAIGRLEGAHNLTQSS